MAKLDAEKRELIKSISPKTLQAIVLKLAEKRPVYNYILVNYIDLEEGEQELLTEAISLIDTIREKPIKARTQRHKLSKLLAEYLKIIKEYSPLWKNKQHEVDLIIYCLEKHFKEDYRQLGLKASTFDTKMVSLTRRALNLIVNKLHEDYKLEYEERMNGFLEKLHTRCGHLISVTKLPTSI